MKAEKRHTLPQSEKMTKKIFAFLALIAVVGGIFAGCWQENRSKLEFAKYDDGRAYVVTGGTVPEDGHLVIPGTYRGKPVVRIETEAFKESKVTRLTLSEGLLEIGPSAFSGCTELTQVSFPNSLKDIGYYSFTGCTALQEVVIPDGVTFIGGSAFSDCMALTAVHIGNGVTTVGTKAFFCCENLESVYIGDRVLTIGQYAFHKCLSLKTVRMPKDIESISKYAFRKCESLTTVYCSGQWKDWDLVRVEGGNEFLTGAGVICQFAGDRLPETVCQHVYDQWTKLDDRLHQRTCTLCGAMAAEAHTWSETDSCSVCSCIKTEE